MNHDAYLGFEIGISSTKVPTCRPLEGSFLLQRANNLQNKGWESKVKFESAGGMACLVRPKFRGRGTEGLCFDSCSNLDSNRDAGYIPAFIRRD